MILNCFDIRDGSVALTHRILSYYLTLLQNNENWNDKNKITSHHFIFFYRVSCNKFNQPMKHEWKYTSNFLKDLLAAFNLYAPPQNYFYSSALQFSFFFPSRTKSSQKRTKKAKKFFFFRLNSTWWSLRVKWIQFSIK